MDSLFMFSGRWLAATHYCMVTCYIALDCCEYSKIIAATETIEIGSEQRILCKVS